MPCPAEAARSDIGAHKHTEALDKDAEETLSLGRTPSLVTTPAEPAPAPEGRRERKKREMRARIYETARELFLARGFEATTVDQIAEAADVAPATFFNYFQSKQAVLGEMTREVFDHMEELFQQQLTRGGSAQSRIAGLANRVAEEVAGARGLARDVMLELMRTSGRAGEALPYLAQVREPFLRLITEGQEAGEIRTDLDAPFLAEMVFGGMNTVIIQWMADENYPMESRIRQAADFLSEAIEPPRTTTGG